MRGYIHNDIVSYRRKIKVWWIGPVKQETLMGLVVGLAIAVPLFILCFFLLELNRYASVAAAAMAAYYPMKIAAFRKDDMNFRQYKAVEAAWKKGSAPITLQSPTSKYSTFERKRRELIVPGKKRL